MKTNPNILLIIIAIGMFAIGAIFTEGRIRRSENRKLIKEIRAEQKKINYKIDSIYATAIEQERIIIDEIKTSYQILKDISEEKGSLQKNYTKQQGRIEEHQNKIDKLKKNLGRDFIFIPEKEKN